MIAVVDQESAAFAANEVLGFMKALGCKCAKRSQMATSILTKQAVGVVFHHGLSQYLAAMAHDRVHFATRRRHNALAR